MAYHSAASLEAAPAACAVVICLASYVPICRVLSWEAPEGSQPAFASGDVVDGTDATGIRAITERHSLPPSSHVRTAIGPSCDVLSLVGSDTDLSCSVEMTR
jgi:hypothetical protein